MRVSELFTEASIFTRGTYSYGHKVRVASRSQKGQALETFIKQQIPDFNSNEDLEWVATPPPNSVTIQAGKGDEEGYFKRPNGQGIIIKGTKASFEKALTHAPGQKGSTAENKGDLSEPVLSAAVVAKLIKRGSDSIENVDVDDVKRVLNSALATDGKTYSVEDLNSKIADRIEFTIAIRGPAQEYMKSPDFWKSFGDKVNSAVHYANSGEIDRYADYFYKNGKADAIVIRSDGMSAQKERKTDIEAYANGKPLSRLNISLKAGSPHIGQIGGGMIGKPEGPKGVWTNANKLFGSLGVNVSKPTKVESKVGFWVSAYKEAAEQLKSELAGQDARNEAGVLSKIANTIASHGTSGDPNVRLVSLNKGGVSSIHSFKDLERKLQAEDINLDARYREGFSKATNEPRPELIIFNKSTNEPLIRVRYSATTDGKKVWNTIEMHSLLKRLTTISKSK